MDVSTLTTAQRNVRSAVRAFLMLATLAELVRELELSEERKDTFRAECIHELMAEFE